MIVKGCIGIFDKAWLVMADGKEIEFGSLKKLLLELEGDLQLSDIKGVKLKVSGETKTYLLADANVIEHKKNGMITIKVLCGQEPPVEGPGMNENPIDRKRLYRYF